MKADRTINWHGVLRQSDGLSIFRVNNGETHWSMLKDRLSKAVLTVQQYSLQANKEDWDYATEPNWDGEGSPALTAETVSMAQRLLDKFSCEAPSEVSPGIDGSLSFVWRQRQEYVFLDVGPSNTIHLYYDTSNGKWEGVSIEGDEELEKHLKKAFARSDVSTFVDLVHARLEKARAPQAGTFKMDGFEIGTKNLVSSWKVRRASDTRGARHFSINLGGGGVRVVSDTTSSGGYRTLREIAAHVA